MKTIPFILLGLLPVLASAQFPENKPDPKIEQLGFLVGNWKGEGWIRFPGLPKSPFTGTEKVQFKAGSNALQIEGLHSVQDPATDQAKVIHNAFAIVTWNSTQYRFQSILASGHRGDYVGEFRDDAFVWGYENRWQGKVRYTIRINEAGDWFEIGESSRDGKTWTQFFEMTLQKQP